MESEIIFGDEKLEASFNELKDSKFEDRQLYLYLQKAFEHLRIDAFCGVQIPKRLIPKFYGSKFGKLDNLWKYGLPSAWRLVYTIKNENVVVLSIVLEWMDHKDYERRFKY